MGTLRNAQYWKDKLGLTTHVEGGSFKEIYRAPLVMPKEALTTEHKAARNAATAIYFLLEYGDFSAFHRIASDELWHYYDGGTLCIYEIAKAGTLVKHLLGIDGDALPQVTIPAGSWFGSRVEEEGSYTLCGCTVAPGFDFDDFELANGDELCDQYPEHMVLIKEMTR